MEDTRIIFLSCEVLALERKKKQKILHEFLQIFCT